MAKTTRADNHSSSTPELDPQEVGWYDLAQNTLTRLLSYTDNPKFEQEWTITTPKIEKHFHD